MGHDVRIHQSPFPPPRVPEQRLEQYVLEGAARRGEHAALVDAATGVTTTYAALDEASARGAAKLRTEGLRPGDVVGLVGPNSADWVVSFFAVLRAGGVVTPLNPSYTVEETRKQLRDAGARRVLADVQVLDKVAPAAREVDATASVLFRAVSGRTEDGAPGPVALDRGGAETVAIIPFSSGTTGLSKGVLLTHRNLVANLEQHREIQPAAPGDVLCGVLPFFHIYGLMLVLNVALRNGATVVILPRFDLERYVSAIERYRVTQLHTVPPMVLGLASSPIAEGRDFSSVRTVVCGAAPLEAALAERAAARLGVPVRQGYGMTEASPGTHLVPANGSGHGVPLGSVGYLVPGTEAKIIDSETRDASGSTGELWVRGPQVMQGYLDAPEATAATLVDGWLRTGDLVRVDERGVFFIVDRLKELIKYNGYQVAPAELEAVLRTHPLVADAAVLGVPDGATGERPRAYVVAKSALSGDDLLDFVAQRVAPHKKVREVVFVDQIPRSPSGKILRRDLPR